MSSHHIVREKQEPALLALGLDSFPDEMLGQLLEWCPTIITCSQTAEKLVACGIKIDWIITNGASDVLQPHVKYLQCADDNITAAALKFLLANGYPAVNIITEELNLKDCLAYADQIDLVIFNNNRKIFPVYAGFRKWKQAGELIEILGPEINIRVRGLQKINENQYRTTSDGFFSLDFEGTHLFISEEI